MSETIGETSVLINPANLKSEPIDRPHSPESNCAICLEEFTNKSFTNSCLHQFCYNCLKEWSKIKPECPLCKQRFHTIIYNVRSLDDFEEYHVNAPNIEFDQTVFINFAFPPSPVPYSFRSAALDFRRNQIDFRQRMAVDAEVYPTMNTSSSMLYIREVNGLVRATDTIHPAALPLEHEFRPPNLGLSRYRRDIYRRGRWVRPAMSSRIRQSSPGFYRLNPAQTHRLVPWITRELNVLLDVSIDPQTLVQEILNLITLYPIQSRHFREAIRPHLGERTEHFVHEFYHFAISPHDIISYDIMAEYGPQDTRPHRLAREESSESDSDVEVVNILRANVPVGLDLSNHAGPSNVPTFTETVIEISDDSSNSDHEVEIVGMISPVTPETIVIESTDDEMNEPEVELNSNSLLNSSATKSNDSSMEQDFDPNQPCTSAPVIPNPFKSFAPVAKDTTTSSSSTSSTSSSSSSSSSSSPSSSVYSSSLSSVSDSEYGKKRSSHKRKKRKAVRHDKIKRRRRRARIESSSSEDDFPSKKMLNRRLKSVVIKPEDKSLSGSYSDSD
ncbi:unnamed protein product [Nezara viridula]|uniref:E3 ubiquitin-protein ligase Topors n=1 Tax=Nezara viridula TaxID=85310 RepID=A0A9P0H8J1_NEZVI|nr:unnamed protein product [Nezara viridula]